MAEVGSLEALWREKLSSLHGLAVSIAAERERGNEVGVKALREMFARVVADMRAINVQLHKEDSELDWADRFLLSVDSGARNLWSAVGPSLRLLVPMVVLAVVLLVVGSGKRLMEGGR